MRPRALKVCSLSLKRLHRKFWWVKLSWEASPLAHLTKKKRGGEKKRKGALQVSLQHPRVLGVGFDGSQLQGTGNRVVRVWNVSGSAEGGGAAQWGDISAGTACGSRKRNEVLFFSPPIRWKRCWVAVLRPVMASRNEIRSLLVLCVDLPHGAVINLVYFSQFSVHPRGNVSFPLPPRHSLSLSAGTITFVNSAASARSSVESAPRLLCLGITQVNLNVFGCSAQHFETLFFKNGWIKNWMKNALGENLTFAVGPLVAKKKKKNGPLCCSDSLSLPSHTILIWFLTKKVRSDEWARAHTHRGCS